MSGLLRWTLAIGIGMCNVYQGHWTLAEWPLEMGWPFTPISMNMSFGVHACVGHWPVDIALAVETSAV